MFNDCIYNWVGRVVGFILCPLAVLGVLVPFTTFPTRSATVLAGSILVAVAVGIVFGNAYLYCRRCTVDDSASPFPLFASIAASSGIVVLFGFQYRIPAIAIIADLLGQPFLGICLASILGLGGRRTR